MSVQLRENSELVTSRGRHIWSVLYAFVPVAVLILTVLTFLVLRGEELLIDTVGSSIFTALNSATPFFVAVAVFGSTYAVLTVLLLMIVFLIVKKDYIGAFIFFVGGLTAYFSNSIFKDWIGRPRPSLQAVVESEGYSFPSGHMMVGFVLYSLVAYYVIKHVTFKFTATVTVTCVALLLFLMGISRVALGVHYLSDVVAGICAGYIVFITFVYINQRISKRKYA
ncbi:phosphatase PAP2 family protein [Bacillus sp. HMF5848]|uniref:phosphatase PAP2 family protein n=1 Tax=Bacillus sp. HMF5848 TaxID=2495421 RepID=UPI000F79F193|nr:phosphatase PAP2 family protein [Bacillus sp. HMF5848]RSK26330.1 phosphatase PAP2 family protein [Bacillus sp. HMF5848]